MKLNPSDRRELGWVALGTLALTAVEIGVFFALGYYTPKVLYGAILSAAGGIIEIFLLAVAVTRAEMFAPLERRAADVSVTEELKRRAGRPDRSLLKNGALDGPGGWSNSVKDGSLTFDTACKVAGAASAKLTTSTGVDKERYRRATCVQKVRLVKGRRYRLSYFAKGENVEPYHAAEGAGLCMWEGKELYTKHPQPLLTGTFDWLHLSHVFTARDEDVRFEFRITEATGTMWLDEIRLEEID